MKILDDTLQEINDATKTDIYIPLYRIWADKFYNDENLPNEKNHEKINEKQKTLAIQLLQALEANRHLTVINVDTSFLEIVDAESFATATQNVESLIGLGVIDNNPLDLNALQTLVAIIGENLSITDLAIEVYSINFYMDNKTYVETFSQFIGENKTLKRLELCMLDFDTPFSDSDSDGETYATKYVRRLDDINVRAAALTSNSSLEALSVGHSRIGDEGIKIILESVKGTQIKELDITGNKLTPEGEKEITAMLSEDAFKSLKVIGLTPKNSNSPRGFFHHQDTVKSGQRVGSSATPMLN